MFHFLPTFNLLFSRIPCFHLSSYTRTQKSSHFPSQNLPLSEFNLKSITRFLHRLTDRFG
ncbi:hypothetical protein AKJ16_DCAP13596 [Drosera capensis]